MMTDASNLVRQVGRLSAKIEICQANVHQTSSKFIKKMFVRKMFVKTNPRNLLF
jgi:hypothetical protein